MTDGVPELQQEFWLPSVLSAEPDSILSAASPLAPASCVCGSEFMIAARYCHACGKIRAAVPMISPIRPPAKSLATHATWTPVSESAGAAIRSLADAWQHVPFPTWLRYLHFHEIKRCIGLPTAAMIALFVGLGCIAGAIGVSLFYQATTLAEFQAIQMWRVEWLLAATASFVAGILLKRPSQ